MRNTAAALAIALGLGMATTATDAAVIFNTFVSSADIAAAEGGNTSVIAFNYTGSGFVGSVYPNTNQLYSTDLTGHNVAPFGSPIPGFSGEIVIGAGLGQGGFAVGTVYAGNGSGPQIYTVPAVGAPTPFASVPDGGVVRQIFMDPGSTFGGNMLVSTNQGHIYSITSGGVATLIASIGSDTEGMDIASSAFGPHSGALLVASEGSSAIYAVDPTTHVVTTIYTGVSVAETISTVPSNLCSSNNPLQGFYVANYASNIQKADASEFCAYQGDAIVTQEFGSNSPVSVLHWDGSMYTLTLIGNLPGQSEDGIFVTAQRIADVCGAVGAAPCETPEPANLALFGLGLAGLGVMRRRRAA